MPPPLRSRVIAAGLLCAALALAAAPASHAALSGGGDGPAAAPAPDPLDKIRHIPESNPYRATLATWLSLPTADRSAITDWANSDFYDTSPPAVLNAEQKTLASQLAAALRDAASAPSTTASDWPLQYDPQEPDNAMFGILPEIGDLRTLARATTKIADESPPSEAVSLYAATARLGRETRHGATIIQQLTGIAIDDLAQAGAARRLGDFSPQELETLSTAWNALPPGADLSAALDAERTLAFRYYADKLLLPGVKAYLAAGEPSFDASPDDTVADAAIARLRLSALVDFGDGEKQITLENRDTGEAFTVTQKRPAEGVELLDFDIPGQRATIRVHGREAVINLQTKEIVARSDAVKKFLKLFGHGIFADEPANPSSAARQSKVTRQDWIQRIKNHPGGPDGYFAEALENYDQSLARQVADAELTAPPDRASQLHGDSAPDPILALVTPTVSGVARTLHASETNTLMLQAAIRHRLGQDAQAPADPWSATSPDEAASPFVFTATPDGGFTLASRYQRRKDEPVTYKFAAPDAGSVRPKPPAPVAP